MDDVAATMASAAHDRFSKGTRPQLTSNAAAKWIEPRLMRHDYKLRKILNGSNPVA
jgi:hypothetical protein